MMNMDLDEIGSGWIWLHEAGSQRIWIWIPPNPYIITVFYHCTSAMTSLLTAFMFFLISNVRFYCTGALHNGSGSHSRCSKCICSGSDNLLCIFVKFHLGFNENSTHQGLRLQFFFEVCASYYEQITLSLQTLDTMLIKMLFQFLCSL